MRWLREAEALFGSRGYDRLARRSRALLGEAGAPVPRRGRGDSEVPASLRARGVTSREVDVLKLVVAGRTNKEIAAELFLSPKTVERHLTSLFTRTGVANRQELAAVARPHLGDASLIGGRAPDDPHEGPAQDHRMQTNIHEIADGVYRLSTVVPEVAPGGFTFNQYLLDGDEPLLFHTGARQLFPLVSEAVAKVIDVDQLRWISFGHVESDECGSMNQWLAAAPNARCSSTRSAAWCRSTTCATARRTLVTEEQGHELGGHVLRCLPTPHVPHGWEAQVLFDETTRTLFCGDLFTQIGEGPAIVHDADLIQPALDAEDLFGATALTANTAPTIRQLAELEPRTLALMHGPAFAGDCRQALLDLADAYEARFTASLELDGELMRQELTTDTVERYIEASPEALYDLIADVTRTPERTPDIVRSSGSTAPPAPPWAPASRRSTSRAAGPSWSNKPVITVADPGREIAWTRTEPFAGTILWRHRFEPEGSGTRVIESYEVIKPISIVGWFIIDTLYGMKDRQGDLRASMLRTLDRLAELVEPAHESAPTEAAATEPRP